MSKTIIEEPHKIKRTPNGNTWSMRFAVDEVVYRSYGKSEAECIANANRMCEKLEAEEVARKVARAEHEAWMNAQE